MQNINETLKKLYEIYDSPIPDYDKILEAIKNNKRLKRENDIVLRDLVIAISVCHNVTPVINDEG